MVAVLETVLVNEPLPGAVRVTVKLVLVFAARLNAVQVTAPLLLLPPLEALKNAAPTGIVSVTATLVEVLGPALVTVRV